MLIPILKNKYTLSPSSLCNSSNWSRRLLIYLILKNGITHQTVTTKKLPQSFVAQILKLSAVLIITILIYGCANNKAPTKDSSPMISSAKTTQNESNSAYINSDPFETYNRGVFTVNVVIDKAIIRPTTVGYITYIPGPIRSGIGNFFSNLRDFVTLGNDILQLNGKYSMQTLMRISINSTVGILGIIDVSTSLGLNMHKNSFGKTMKEYGWEHSSYFIIPLLGPSTVRDALGTIPNVVFNPTWYVISNDYISVALFASNAIDTRSKYLDSDKIFYSSLDPYITMRDVYLQAINEPITNSDDVSIDTLLLEESQAK